MPPTYNRKMRCSSHRSSTKMRTIIEIISRESCPHGNPIIDSNSNLIIKNGFWKTILSKYVDVEHRLVHRPSKSGRWVRLPSSTPRFVINNFCCNTPKMVGRGSDRPVRFMPIFDLLFSLALPRWYDVAYVPPFCCPHTVSLTFRCEGILLCTDSWYLNIIVHFTDIQIYKLLLDFQISE